MENKFLKFLYLKNISEKLLKIKFVSNFIYYLLYYPLNIFGK